MGDSRPLVAPPRGLSRRLAGGFEEFDQLPEAVIAEMGQLPAMGGGEGVLQALDEFQSGGRDGGTDDAAIGFGAAPADEAAFFEAVEQAGDIGIAGEHAVGDFSAGQALKGAAGLDAAEDSQDVVLRGREADGLKHFDGVADEHVGGPDDIEVRFEFERVERQAFSQFLLQLSGHTSQYTRCNNYRQDVYFSIRRFPPESGLTDTLTNGKLAWITGAGPPLGISFETGGFP